MTSSLAAAPVRRTTPRVFALVVLTVIAACTPAAMQDQPDGMLAPFPADEHGREVPHERMVPYLVEQSVALALGGARAPVPPAAPLTGAAPLVDPRNEPVLLLADPASGISAPWPPEREFTLRPPTRDELRIVPLGRLGAGSTAAELAPAVRWLGEEARRPRPGLQRFTDSVLLVADRDRAVADVRAVAAVLVRLGAARSVRVAVRAADGRLVAAPLPIATLPVPALEERARAAAPAPPADGATPMRDAGPDALGERLREVLAQPIPGPRCHEVTVTTPEQVRVAVAAVLAGSGPHDVVAVQGLAPTLEQYLHPERLVEPALASRVKLDDRCE